jgi:hypothetical protein
MPIATGKLLFYQVLPSIAALLLTLSIKGTLLQIFEKLVCLASEPVDPTGRHITDTGT